MGGKPSKERTFQIGAHSIRSNAFSISTLIVITLPFPFLCWIVWKASAARVKFSWIILFCTKSNWYGEINLRRKERLLVAKFFYIILSTILHRLRGLTWVTRVGWSILGTKARKVELSSDDIIPVRKKSGTCLIKSWRIIVQYVWKKSKVIPSGPKAFIGFIERKAAKISSSPRITLKKSCSDGVKTSKKRFVISRSRESTCGEEKMVHKHLTNILLIYDQLLELSLIELIPFLLLQMIVEVKKNLVLSSWVVSHWMRHFCFHKSCSLCNYSSNKFFTWISY